MPLAFALALSACGQASQDPNQERLEVAGFEDYVSRFERAATEHGHPLSIRNLVIQFGEVDQDDENGGRGVCEAPAGRTPVITIHPEAWETSDDAEREQLVFHELGHCILGKTHEGGIGAAGIPRSMMNPYRINGSIYSQNREYYLAELFHP